MLGGAAAFSVHALSDGDLLPATFAALGVWVWAGARLLLLSWAAPEQLDAGAIRGVWGIGTVPTLFAATPILAGVAFVAGAWLTGRAAHGAGASTSQAALMVAAAFGAQVAVLAASSVLRVGALLVL